MQLKQDQIQKLIQCIIHRIRELNFNLEGFLKILSRRSCIRSILSDVPWDISRMITLEKIVMIETRLVLVKMKRI